MTTPSDDADPDFTVTPADITAADSADKTALNSADEISELMKDYGISEQPQGFVGGSGAGAGSEEDGSPQLQGFTGGSGAGAGSKEDGSPQLQGFTGGSGAGAGSKGSGSRQPRFTGTLVAGARRAGRSSAVRGRTIKVGAGAVAAAAANVQRITLLLGQRVPEGRGRPVSLSLPGRPSRSRASGHPHALHAISGYT